MTITVIDLSIESKLIIDPVARMFGLFKLISEERNSL